MTTTSAAPAVCDAVFAVIEIELTTTTLVAGEPPIETVAPERNPVPVIVTEVPPEVEPEVGEMAVTVGAGFVYVKPLVSVPLCASVLVTTTLTAPVPCAGVVAVMLVLPTTTTLVAAVPPIDTVAPLKKPVPLIVTAVPPAVVPDAGEMPVTVGAGFGEEKVYPPLSVPL